MLLTNIDLCIESIKEIGKSGRKGERKNVELFAVVLVNGFKNGKGVVEMLLREQGVKGE